MEPNSIGCAAMHARQCRLQQLQGVGSVKLECIKKFLPDEGVEGTTRCIAPAKKLSSLAFSASQSIHMCWTADSMCPSGPFQTDIEKLPKLQQH